MWRHCSDGAVINMSCVSPSDGLRLICRPVANRVMQTPRSAGEVVFHVFDALAYAGLCRGRAVFIDECNTLLLFPLLIWVIAYIFLLRYVVRRVEPASKDSSNARSELNGRVVDAYTNIHSVKMFAHTNSELAYVKDAIEEHDKRFSVKCASIPAWISS